MFLFLRAIVRKLVQHCFCYPPMWEDDEVDDGKVYMEFLLQYDYISRKKEDEAYLEHL